MDIKNVTSNLTTELNNQLNTDYKNLIKVALTIVVLFIVFMIIKRFKKTITKTLKLDENIAKIVFRVSKVLYVFVSFMIVASLLGINTNSILAIFSIFGLAVSLSIQNLMSNLANAISIFTNKPFIIGDYVNIAGTEGTVEDISFMYTKLITTNAEAVYLNNTTVGTSNIINYTKHDIRRISQTLSLSYNASVDIVKKAIRETIDNESLVLKDEPIYIALSSYSESSIDYTVRVYTKKENFIECRDRLLENYKVYFDKYNLEIPYPNLTVHIDNK